MKKLRLITFLLIALAASLAFIACEKSCEHEYVTAPFAQDCEKEVIKSETCSKCGDVRNTTIPPRGHNFKKEVIDATCTEAGATKYSCDCGFSYESDLKDPLGHDFLHIITDPACDEIGFTTYVCRTCDHTYVSDHVDPLGHSLEAVITEPTCTSYGFTTYTCDECEFTYVSDSIEPKGHSLDESITDPTCTDSGFTAYSCSRCEFSYNSDFTEPLGHKFSSEIKSSASCTKSGETLYFCECGYTYSEIEAPLGHDFEKTVISPTVSDMGYTEFSCRCGFNYRGNYRFYSEILDNAYAGNDKVIAHGIDISRWNHTVDSEGNYEPIDWSALKAAGVDYVILKIGSSVRDGGNNGGIEPTFEMDYKGAKEAGLDVGVYFFTYSTSVSQIKRDAENVLTWLDGKQFEYPIYLDLEDSEKEDYFASQVASPILTEMCLTFFSELQKEGYYTGLYVNNEFLFNILQTENMIDLFEIWYARYPSSSTINWSIEETVQWNTEKYGEHLGMWQYCYTGVLPSITTEVDFNYAYKDYPTLIKSNGFNGYDYVENEDPDENNTEETSSPETDSEIENTQ